MSDNKPAFALLKERLVEQAAKVLYNCAADVVNTVKTGYENMDVVRSEDGNVLSKIDPKTIAPAVSAKIEDLSVVVYIVGDAENDEAHRQYALGLGSDIVRNPFLAALYRLRQPETISKVTGLDTK